MTVHKLTMIRVHKKEASQTETEDVVLTPVEIAILRALVGHYQEVKNLDSIGNNFEGLQIAELVTKARVHNKTLDSSRVSSVLDKNLKPKGLVIATKSTVPVTLVKRLFFYTTIDRMEDC